MGRWMILSHETARAFWRAYGDRYSHAHRLVVSGRFMTKVTFKAAEVVAHSFNLPLPLHVMTLEPKEGSRSERYIKHIFAMARRLPCVMEISDGLYVVCPELCFVQVAQVLQPVDLIKWGFEICGSYMPDPQGVAKQRFRRELCTPEGLREFIDGIDSRFNGIVAARKALRYVIPGSASPAETAFEAQMHIIARTMGRRIRIADPSGFTRKQLELRARLAPWLVPAAFAPRYSAS